MPRKKVGKASKRTPRTNLGRKPVRKTPPKTKSKPKRNRTLATKTPKKSVTFKGNAKRRYAGSVDATHRRMKKKSDSIKAHRAKNKPNYKKMGKAQSKR